MSKKAFQVRHGLRAGSTLVIDTNGNWLGNTIPATKGGVGQTTYATGDILYASDVDTLSKLTAGTGGQVLTMGSPLLPLWATPSGGAGSINTDINTATPPTTEAVTGNYEIYDLAGDDQLASVGFLGSQDLQIKNKMRGGAAILEGTDAAGSNRWLFYGDPDGVTWMTYAGGQRLNTAASGVLQLKSNGSGDNDNRYLAFTHSGGTTKSLVGMISGVLYLSQKIHGNTLVIDGEDTGGVAREFLSGDPDALTTLTADTDIHLKNNVGADEVLVGTAAGATAIYYAGASKLATTNTGVLISTDINTSTPPTSEAVTGNYEIYDLAGDDLLASAGFTGNSTFEIRNHMRGAPIQLATTTAAGASQPAWFADPDHVTNFFATTNMTMAVDGGVVGLVITGGGGVSSYYDGDERFRVSNGSVEIFANGTASNPPIPTDAINGRVDIWDEPRAQRLCEFGMSSTDDAIRLYSYVHGAPILLKGQDASGTDREMFSGDPDALTTLTADTDIHLKNNVGADEVLVGTAAGATAIYYAGASKLATTNTGIAVTGEITLTTALDETYGGTGQTVYTVGDIMYASTTTVLSKLAIGSNTDVLTLAGGVPTWAAPTGGTATDITITTDGASAAYKIPFANTVISSTGDYTLLQDSTATFTYNPGTNTITASTFSGALSGNATTATTATDATNVTVTTDVVNAAYKIPFANTVVSSTGEYGLLQDSTATFTYNPGTNTITASTFSGALIGNATSATSATTATDANNITITPNAVSSDYKVPFADTVISSAGEYGLLQDASATFTYNPSTNTLTADNFAGNATTATTATTATGSTNVTISASSSTDTTLYPVLVGAATTGNQLPLLDNAGFSYNGSTNTINAINLTATTAVDAASLNVNTGGNLRVYDAAGQDYFQIEHTGSAVAITTAGSGGGSEDIRITPGSTNVVVFNMSSTDVFRSQHSSTSGNTSGAEVKGHLGVWHDVGFNDLLLKNDNVSDTLEAGHAGLVAFKDATTARTLTLAAVGDLDFPVGAFTTVINAFTSTDYTITEGATTTLYHLDGTTRVDTAGGTTVAPGGVVTIWREAAGVYYIWGTGLTEPTLAETSGGTGQTTYTTGDILYSDSANSLAKLAIGSNTDVLTLAGGVPTWAAGATAPTEGTVQTTTASQTELLAVSVASGVSVGYEATVIGRQDATGDTVLETITGLISNEAGTTALIGTPGVDRHEAAGAATWAVIVAADDTSDELTFDVTGESSHTIDWKIKLTTIDV